MATCHTLTLKFSCLNDISFGKKTMPFAYIFQALNLLKALSIQALILKTKYVIYL